MNPLVDDAVEDGERESDLPVELGGGGEGGGGPGVVAPQQRLLHLHRLLQGNLAHREGVHKV